MRWFSTEAYDTHHVSLYGVFHVLYHRTVKTLAGHSGIPKNVTIYSTDESQALKALYHSAINRYHAMRKELRRREAFNVVETRKSKKLPTSLLQKQVERAKVDVLNAKKAYAPHNVLDCTYSRTNPTQPPVATDDAEFRSGIAYDDRLLNFDDYSGQTSPVWVEWPEEARKVDFVSVMKGFGDGEQRIAYTFGGSMMGGNKSYDIFIRDHGRWEVKDLTNGNDIRPGTQGARFYSNIHARIVSAFLEIGRFVREAMTWDRFECASVRERKMLTYIDDFVTANFANMVEAGEISKTRFVEFKKVITYVSAFKRKRETDVIHSVLTDDFFVEGLDHRTYVSIAKSLARSNEFILQKFDAMDLALDNLHDEMFDDPDELVKLVNSIMPSNIFGHHADGLILVHREKGFMILKGKLMDDYIILDQVTQSKPKFRLVNKKENITDEDNQSELQDRTVPDVPGSVSDSGTCCEDVLQV